MSFRIIVLLLAGCVFVAPSQAQKDKSTKVLKADRYLDVRSGEMVSPAIIVIEGGEISAINPRKLPENASVVEFEKNTTLLPGLIDSHVHLTYELTADTQLREVTETTSDRALRGAFNARKTLMAGFTTVRDLGSDGFNDVALAKASNAGFIDAPRIIASGYPLSITGGHGDASGFASGIKERDYRAGTADGVDEVVKAVRYQIKHGAKVIKIFATAGVLSFEESLGAQQYTSEEMRAAVEEAARHDIKVAAHAHGTEGIKAAIKAGVASIEHSSILDDEAIELMKSHGTYLVPTTYLAESINMEVLPPLLREKAERVIPLAIQSLENAIAAGVKIAFGTDAAVIPHGDNGKEFAVLVKRGMSPLTAIQSATIYAAELLDVDDRAEIKTGLKADIIAVEGNPLDKIEVLEDPVFIMKGGKVYN